MLSNAQGFGSVGAGLLGPANRLRDVVVAGLKDWVARSSTNLKNWMLTVVLTSSNPLDPLIESITREAVFKLL